MIQIGKALYIKEVQQYSLLLPYGTYEINGEIVDIKEGLGKEVLSPTATVYPLTPKGCIKEYISVTDDRDVLSISEYVTKEVDILKGATFTNRDEDGNKIYNYLSPQQEIEHLVFKKTYTPVWIERLIKGGPLYLEVQKLAIDTGSPFIIPLYSLGERSELVTYQREKAIQAEVEKVLSSNLDKTQYEIPNHSGIRYVKVGGRCIFSRAEYHIPHTSVKTTLEKAWGMYEEDMDRISTILMGHISLLKKDIATPESVWLDVLEKLRMIEEYVWEIEPKVKSESKATTVRRLTNTLKRDILSFISEGEGNDD